MDRVIARTSDGASLIVVITLTETEVRRRYRMLGGPHDGEEFDTFGEFASWATVNGIHLLDAG